jgi:hypothetical protein
MSTVHQGRDLGGTIALSLDCRIRLLDHLQWVLERRTKAKVP